MMTVKIGRTPHPVETFADASALWLNISRENDHTMHDAPPVEVRDGKKRYVVSYNGKVWDGERCIYNPYEATP